MQPRPTRYVFIKSLSGSLSYMHINMAEIFAFENLLYWLRHQRENVLADLCMVVIGCLYIVIAYY
jgi:hypothetical protein